MLEEQKAVVVGGTSGIGLAAAIELCRAGAQVWVTGRTPDKAMAAAAAIGDRAAGYAVDARDAVKLQDFFARVGEFDHLIVALGGGPLNGREGRFVLKYMLVHQPRRQARASRVK